MARRILTVDSDRWEVFPSGRVTVYGRDQFGLIFEQGTGPQRRRRVTHYSPLGARSPDRAFAALSDGECAPAEVARRARAVDLAAIALTDHDTTDGVADAQHQAAQLGVRVIPGCEFSVRAPWGELHVLAMFLPYENERLQEFLRATRAARRRRGEQIVAKLQGLGVAIELEDVQAQLRR